MKRVSRWIALLMIFVACAYLFPTLGFAAESKSRVLRVAYPLQDGLSMVDEDGGYYGYTYDYLAEVSKYTGWIYEIVRLEGSVDEQSLEALEMLERGEVDLLGGLQFHESLTEKFSFPGYCYGTNYMGIFVPFDSSLTESTLYAEKKIRVGVYRRDGTTSPKLEQFAQMNNLNIEQSLADSVNDLQNMVESGEVDAILSTDLSIAEHSGMYAIAHFSPTPFYFATIKGRVDIIRQLDYAMSIINQVTPDFASEVYNKYFSPFSSELRFTSEEMNFIENASIQEVGVYGNHPPFYSVDSDTGEASGILVEVFNQISSMTGLKFHFTAVTTYDDYIAFLQSGRADIVANALLLKEEAFETGSTLTLPWHNLPIHVVFRGKNGLKEDGKYAIPYSLKNAIPFQEDIQYYDTEEQCMQAIQKGKVDYALVGEFCSQYLISSNEYNDLKVLNQQDSLTQKMCFGIVDSHDFYLLSIFNKCITALSGDKIEEIIYRNTYYQHAITFSQWIANNKGQFLLFVLVLVILYMGVYLYLERGKRQRIAFENKRYNTLSNLSNEFIYEYDLQRDGLVLPQRCADYFSCETHLKRFSEQLASLKESERIGIWEMGSWIIATPEGMGEISCQIPNQSRQWFRIVSYPVVSKRRELYIGKMVNIQEVKVEQIRLEQKAVTDGLTGLYNVVAVKEMVRECLEYPNGEISSAFMILDVDRFKGINDTLGHYNGDLVLIQLAKLLTKVFHSHIIGRMGGDEFVVFVKNTSIQELENSCRELSELLESTLEALLGISVTLSIGISFAKEGHTYEALYKEADKALYKRKSLGKNGFTFYVPE